MDFKHGIFLVQIFEVNFRFRKKLQTTRDFLVQNALMELKIQKTYPLSTEFFLNQIKSRRHQK